ncbi:site-2 protease family protein [Candidatus Methanoperedens nitratireducens]|uniref:Peptidase M50 family protein n=1 Tax=Candidatus Methanoperedens nitratireducens TaxID=1392998 RepID=A0A284VR79_9EURY|nr:site-2 protease family protein [Candidatus Methanoperedens nitroreducens]SNQ61772.1 Peptidase M50 family protein [Candidatus Methanoperedens nitroreducens]
MNYYNLLLLFLLYWLFVMFLDRRGILSKYNITAYGPILMVRTQKGQRLLDKLAVHKSFWRIFANIGLPAMLIGMLVMFLLILFVDFALIRSFQTQTIPPPTRINEPRNFFLIPGINEYIPFEWGVIALIVTLIVHEFSHAILCKVEGIRVKSMGILLAVIPIGGFAEPDEDQLLGKKEEKNEKEPEPAPPKKVATRGERVRVLTAGVMANFATAFVAFILFFSLLGSISPVGEVMVTSVIPGHPADAAGVKPNMIITQLNDKQVNSAEEFMIYMNTLQPGSKITLNVIENRERKVIDLVTTSDNSTYQGIKVYDVVPGSPAEAAGIKPDMVLVRVNNTEIRGLDDFVSFMNSTEPGQKIDVYVLSNNSANASTEVFKNIELTSYPYDKNAKKGFLGISYAPDTGAVSYSSGIGVGQFQAKSFLNMLESIPSLLNRVEGWVYLFSLPIYGFTGNGFPGFSGLMTYFYEPVGWAAPFGNGIFWVLNILMWVGWMNFYVGLFNCLPAVPLDGGHVFRDVMTSSLSRIIGNGEKAEKITNAVVILFAVLILMSLVFVAFAPYAAHGF